MGDICTCDLSLIGQRLTELREKSGLTQDVLSEKIGVSRQAVSQWENGVKEMGLHNAVALCKALDCDLLYLVYGDDSNGYKDRKKEIAGSVTGLSPKALNNLINMADIFQTTEKYKGFVPFSLDYDPLIKDIDPKYTFTELIENHAVDFTTILSGIADVIRNYKRLLTARDPQSVSDRVERGAQSELNKIVNRPPDFDENAFLNAARKLEQSRIHARIERADNAYKAVAFNFSRAILNLLEKIAVNYDEGIPFE